MKDIKIVFTDQRIIPASGLAVVGAILAWEERFCETLQPDGCNVEQISAPDKKWRYPPHLHRYALHGQTPVWCCP